MTEVHVLTVSIAYDDSMTQYRRALIETIAHDVPCSPPEREIDRRTLTVSFAGKASDEALEFQNKLIQHKARHETLFKRASLNKRKQSRRGQGLHPTSTTG